MDLPRNNMDGAEQEQKNRELVEALRKTIEKLSMRLTPEVEPALVYQLKEDAE